MIPEALLRLVRAPLFWVLVLAGWLLFFRLGETTLTNWDEAWFAAVAQDMVERQDWLHPRWNGEPWWYEPPLLTWVLAGVMKYLGSNEAYLRWFNAICGFLTIGLTYVLGKQVWRSRLAAGLAAMVLGSNIEWLFRSRQINTDIPVSLFLLVSLVMVLKAVESKGVRWWVLAGVSWGLAWLTKRASPVLVLPPIIAAIIWGQPGRKRFTLKGVTVLLVSFLVVTLPWYGYMWQRFGNEFVNKFIFGYTIGKITSLNPATANSITFYVESLKHAFKLWFLVLPLALVWAVNEARLKWRVRVVLVYIVTFLGALTLVPIKASWYLLPAYPVVAVLIGGFVNTLTQVFRPFRSLIILGVIAMFGFQLVRWQTSFMVPDTTRAQAEMARLVGSLPQTEDKVYLDDDWLPVAVFYSQRQVVPLRFNRQLTGDKSLVNIPFGSYVLSNQQTKEELRARISLPVALVATRGDLVLLQAE